MKIYSLLKATFSQDMNLFKVSVKNDSSKLKKIIVPLLLFLIILYATGTYAYGIAQIVVHMQMENLILMFFVIACTIISFVEGVYKSQGLLFDAKDNDLLLSLPITKSQILFVRILKLLVFQYLFNLMFLLPAFVVYAYYTSPDINFYLISLVMSVLVPIIPTVCGSFVGYLIRLISSKFKKKKLIQSFLGVFVTIVIMVGMMNINGFINELFTNAQEVSETIIAAYYPIRLYLNLIAKFNLLDFVLLLMIHIIPLALFILIGQKYYYKIISKIAEVATNNSKNDLKNTKAVYRKPIRALTLKELKRYFSSPIYVFNTLFGPVTLLIATIFLCIEGVNILNSSELPININIEIYLPAIYYALIVSVSALTQITASSVSLEGKTINITRSLPISEKTIFNSKIIMSFIIQLPLVIISNIICIIKFRVNLMYSLLILGISFAVILLISCFGLIINLKYPKMDANNDTEIVKQSMSIMIATFSGLAYAAISVGMVIYLNSYMILEAAIFCHLLLTAILAIVSYIFLIKKGPKIYKNIAA